MNDVVVNKSESIQRCVKRAREEYAAAGDFSADYSRQDAAVLNVTRACEQAIDLANYLVRRNKLGVPKDSSESFDLLVSGKLIDRELAEKLKRMVGFRNTAIHQYQELDLDVVAAVIQSGLNDLLAFTDRILDSERP
jgi:uncharacterized protein YutE (UPF0331/DUF86 family)